MKHLKLQLGQAMVETVVIIAIVMLLTLGAIQFGLIYHAKITLNYATFEAVRAGALNHADKRAIEYALARGLAPLYAYKAPGDSGFDQIDDLKRARDQVLEEINNDEFVCIERLNPTDSAFTAFAVPDPNGFFATDIIPNDNLLYRSTDDQGSGTSIQDANLLKIRVTYCYPMYIPFISSTIRKLMGSLPDTAPPAGWNTPTVGNFKSNCYDNNRFPIVSQSIIRMQTPAKNDTFPLSCE